MASKTLYPPILESYYPAFTGKDALRITFSLSKYNISSDFKNVHLSLCFQSNGKSAIDNTKDNGKSGILIDIPYHLYSGDVTELGYDEDEEIYYIDVPSSALKNGWEGDMLYKIQMRLSNSSYEDVKSQNIGEATWIGTREYADTFSEWSTIAITKCIGNVLVEMSKFNKIYDKDSNISTLNADGVLFGFKGEFKANIGKKDNGDYDYEKSSSEYLSSYRIRLYSDSEFKNLLEDSSVLYSNQTENKNQMSYDFKIDPKMEIGENGKPIPKMFYMLIDFETQNYFNASFKINYKYQPTAQNRTTINLISVDGIDSIGKDSKVYSILKNTSKALEEDNCCIGLKLMTTEDDEKYSGTFLIRRTDASSNFEDWEDLYKFTLPDNITGKQVNDLDMMYDYSAESGIFYKYAIQTYIHSKEVRAIQNVYDKPILRDYTFSSLVGRDGRQLILMFDNTVDSINQNINEAVTPTIGSKYPFITRNGYVKYKTFSLSGVISFHMDENHLFMTPAEIYGSEEAAQLYNKRNQMTYLGKYNPNIFYVPHQDRIYEKAFREKVLEFLSGEDPLLFKSATEGNILVKLTGVTMTPKAELGRMIYSFSATATEIGEPSAENLEKYEIDAFSKNQVKNLFSQHIHKEEHNTNIYGSAQVSIVDEKGSLVQGVR